MKYFKVVFAPSFKEVIIEEGTSILDAARMANVYIESLCIGKSTCGKCKIRLVDGSLSPMTPDEIKFLNEHERELGYRLACLTHVCSDTTIFLSEENILTSRVDKKLFSKRSNVLNPAIKSFRLELATGKDVIRNAYFEDIAKLLGEKFGLENLVCDFVTLQNLAHTLKESKHKATVFVWMDKEIIHVKSGWNETCLGLALDIGTTTLGLYLCDLKSGNIISSGSATNPQVMFGADVMSRIAYCGDHSDVGLKKMQTELICSVNTLLTQMVADKGFSINEIMDMTVVGNTVMHHIFLGIDPDHLGLWPFTPSIQGSVDIKARELGLHINPSAYVHVLPVESGFVGADNIGVLLSEEPYNHDELSLILDLGTNGEIVLGNRDTLLSCSCATGPALEGAHIGSGMRATSGAIEKIRIDPETFEVAYTVISPGYPSGETASDIKPVGICGSGIIDAVAHLFKTGLIGEDGAFSQGINTPRLRMGQSGIMEFVLVRKCETATGSDIVLSQKDIRQIQLAKAALHGGCRVLMDRLKISAINKIVIAGAFGMHIDKENALTIGLFPWCNPDNIIMAGNAAGHGAYLTLINREKRKEAQQIARSVMHIELALEKGFQREFMNALSLPYVSVMNQRDFHDQNPVSGRRR